MVDELLVKVLDNARGMIMSAQSVTEVKKIYREHRVWLRVSAYYNQIFSKDDYNYAVKTLKECKETAFLKFFGGDTVE